MIKLVEPDEIVLRQEDRTIFVSLKDRDLDRCHIRLSFTYESQEHLVFLASLWLSTWQALVREGLWKSYWKPVGIGRSGVSLISAMTTLAFVRGVKFPQALLLTKPGVSSYNMPLYAESDDECFFVDDLICSGDTLLGIRQRWPKLRIEGVLACSEVSLWKDKDQVFKEAYRTVFEWARINPYV